MKYLYENVICLMIGCAIAVLLLYFSGAVDLMNQIEKTYSVEEVIYEERV